MRMGIKNYWKLKGVIVLPLLALTLASAKYEIVILGIGFIIWRV